MEGNIERRKQRDRPRLELLEGMVFGAKCDVMEMLRRGGGGGGAIGLVACCDRQRQALTWHSQKKNVRPLLVKHVLVLLCSQLVILGVIMRIYNHLL